MRGKEELSQEELIIQLRERGYASVTSRQVVDWRAPGLLPAFDVQGSGRGRSQGRKPSRWSDAETIVEQANWIIELLELYGYYQPILCTTLAYGVFH